MRRLVPIAAVLAALAAAAVTTGASGEDDGVLRHKVILDNAFGLTEGADLRAAGVRVGQIEKLEVQSSTARAVATIRVERPEFGGFRRDVFCVVEPQSLIGEYFMDCEPGTAPQRLPDGGTVPVEQTGGTVPPDLVNDILRRPYRERLGILIAELGAAFAARGDDVNAAIGRAIPALRETDRVLRILADERRTIRELIRNGETVISRLDEGGEDLTRFVAEARDAASASADRRTDLAATIRNLPRFQRELRPTLAALGTAAREQTPALANLRAAAPQLTSLLRQLGRFSNASRPAIRSLAEASVTGRRAVTAARPTVAQLRTTAGKSTDPFRNLRFVLEHIDDRDNAVEKTVDAPGKGLTGLEALLRYPYYQSLAINIFDVKGYILKLNALINDCAQYTNARSRIENPERTRRCNADLGPNGPLEPRPEEQSPTPIPRSADATGKDRRKAAADGPAASAGAGGDGKAAPRRGTDGGRRLELPGLPPIELPPLPGAGQQGGKGDQDALLDLLLRP